MFSSRIFLAVAFVLASIVGAEAWKGSSRNLRHQAALHDEESRHLQNGPKHPDIDIVSTTGGKISATAFFYQGGMQYIRLFKEDCINKFDGPSAVQFSVDNDATTDSEWSVNSEWSGKGDDNTNIDFQVPLKYLYEHLSDKNEGVVDVCIELETANTLTYTQFKVELDLMDEAKVVVKTMQPDAITTSVSIETDVTAWVCNGGDATPVIANKIDTLEVPGKIYVCIEVTDGYAIQSGKLSADAAPTGISPDETIANYMDDTVLTTGITDAYNVEDTFQVLSPNLVRVSFMGDKTWAPFQSTSTLTISVDAYFVPVRRFLTPQRRIASQDDADEPAKKFQPGRLRINGDKSDVEFASYTTTVLVKSPPEPKKITAVMAGGIGAGVLVVAAVFFFVVARKQRPNNNNDEKSIDSNNTKSSLEFASKSSIASDSRSVRPNSSTPRSGTKMGSQRIPRGTSRVPSGSMARPSAANERCGAPRGAPRIPSGNGSITRPGAANGGRGAPRGASKNKNVPRTIPRNVVHPAADII